MGNNSVCLFKGVGCIKMKIFNDKVILLKDVRYIPDLKRNLISLSLLDKPGFNFCASNGELLIRKGKECIMKGSLYNV